MRASAGSRRTGTGPRSAFPSLLLAPTLLGSSLVLLPTALPNAAATPYPGPEPTPTNLTVFLHNSPLPQPVTRKFTYAPPSFISTVELQATLALVALALLLVLAIAFLSSRGKRGGAKPSASPPAVKATTSSSGPVAEQKGSNESADESTSTAPAAPVTSPGRTASVSSPIPAPLRSGRVA